MSDEHITQSDVNAWLNSGIVFSIVWLAGIGSLIALTRGLRARRAIAGSRGTVVGRVRAWWCIAVGGLGLLIWMPVVILNVIGFLSH